MTHREREMSATAVLTGLCPPLYMKGSSNSAAPQLQVQLLSVRAVFYAILLLKTTASERSLIACCTPRKVILEFLCLSTQYLIKLYFRVLGK